MAELSIFERILGLILFLLTLLPLVGGSAGALVSMVVDVLKLVFLPDKWGGLVFGLLNLVAIACLYFFFGVTPADIIPEPLSGQLELVVNIIGMVVMLVTGMISGRGVHKHVTTPLAPTRFSHTIRQNTDYQPGVSRGVAVKPLG